MPVNPYSKISENAFSPLRSFWQNVVVFILWIKLNLKYRLKIYGRENIPPRSAGSYIVAANHTSDLDPPIVSVAMRYRNVAYMAKEELFDTPFKAWFYSSTGTFSVNRTKLEISTIRSAKAVIQSGKWLLGIFPEGTRNADLQGGVQELKKGISFIAKSTQAAVLPIGISRNGPEGKNITARIGHLIPYDPDNDAMMMRLQEALVALSGESATFETTSND